MAVKYLYLYMYKGYDRATVMISHQSNNGANQNIIDINEEKFDEIKMYLDAWYVSSSESIWRIFHFKIHEYNPNIQRLAIHLSNH